MKGNPNPGEAHDHEFAEVRRSGPRQSFGISFEYLRRVKMQVTAHLGNALMPVRDILALKRGSVVSLDKMAGEPTDVYVNGLILGKGEVIVVGDMLHVRLSEIAGASEKANESAQ